MNSNNQPNLTVILLKITKAGSISPAQIRQYYGSTEAEARAEALKSYRNSYQHDDVCFGNLEDALEYADECYATHSVIEVTDQATMDAAFAAEEAEANAEVEQDQGELMRQNTDLEKAIAEILKVGHQDTVGFDFDTNDMAIEPAQTTPVELGNLAMRSALEVNRYADYAFKIIQNTDWRDYFKAKTSRREIDDNYFTGGYYRGVVNTAIGALDAFGNYHTHPKFWGKNGWCNKCVTELAFEQAKLARAMLERAESKMNGVREIAHNAAKLFPSGEAKNEVA